MIHLTMWSCIINVKTFIQTIHAEINQRGNKHEIRNERLNVKKFRTKCFENSFYPIANYSR